MCWSLMNQAWPLASITPLSVFILRKLHMLLSTDKQYTVLALSCEDRPGSTWSPTLFTILIEQNYELELVSSNCKNSRFAHWQECIPEDHIANAVKNLLLYSDMLNVYLI